MKPELGDLERRAGQGDSEAQLALARHFDAEGEGRLARGWYARAAKSGSVPALRSLAIHLLTCEPLVPGDGVNMIRSAADKGDAEAAYVCGMLAAQDAALETRWQVAVECLRIAAERGWAPARQQLAFLGADFPARVASLTAAVPVRAISQSPRIAVVEHFANAELCDWLIAAARPRLARAMVYDHATGLGRAESARSNSAIAFHIAQSDLILMLLRERIAATSGLALESLEASSVLHYAPGQQFAPHVDYLDPAVPGYVKDLAENGQRIATFLVYLNEDYEGGETEFCELGIRHKGRKGDALLFWNVTPEGALDTRTRHAGLPTTQGEKWLLSQWLRRRRAR